MKQFVTTTKTDYDVKDIGEVVTIAFKYHHAVKNMLTDADIEQALEIMKEHLLEFQKKVNGD